MNDQTKRTVVITGGTGGIGFQSALGIAKTGAKLLITGRNAERGETAVNKIIEITGNKNVSLVVGDISSIKRIDELASALLGRADCIDVLINNAGYMGGTYAVSDDGLEMHFAINVLSLWRLTNTLVPAMKKAEKPRVLNITGGDKPAAIDPENTQAERGFKGLMTYAHSKSMMESMSLILAKQLEHDGITVNIIFPGRAATKMTSSMTPSALPGAMKLMYPLFKLLFKEDGGKSARKAAQSTIWAATSAKLEGVSGHYYDTNSKEKKLHPTVYDSHVQSSILSIIDSVESNTVIRT